MKKNTHHRHPISLLPLLLIGSTVLVGVTFGLLFAVSGLLVAPATATPVPHFVDVTPEARPAQRTLVVGGANEALPGLSENSGVLISSLIEGDLPADAALATVVTDTNCAPDEQGVSHCLNQLEFGTTQVLVQHHHKMSEVPCLTPGETVRVLSLAQYRSSGAGGVWR